MTIRKEPEYPHVIGLVVIVVALVFGLLGYYCGHR